MKILFELETDEQKRRFISAISENPFVGYVGNDLLFTVTVPDSYTAFDMFYWLGRYNLKLSHTIIEA